MPTGDPPLYPFLAHDSAQEQRIQILEGLARDTAGAVGELSTKIEYTSKAIDDTKHELSISIQKGFGDVLAKVSEQSVKLDAHEARLVTVEQFRNNATKNLENRNDMYRKVVIGLFLSGLGVFMTKFVEHILAIWK